MLSLSIHALKKGRCSWKRQILRSARARCGLDGSDGLEGGCRALRGLDDRAGKHTDCPWHFCLTRILPVPGTRYFTFVQYETLYHNSSSIAVVYVPYKACARAAPAPLLTRKDSRQRQLVWSGYVWCPSRPAIITEQHSTKTTQKQQQPCLCST